MLVFYLSIPERRLIFSSPLPWPTLIRIPYQDADIILSSTRRLFDVDQSNDMMTTLLYLKEVACIPLPGIQEDRREVHGYKTGLSIDAICPTYPGKQNRPWPLFQAAIDVLYFDQIGYGPAAAAITGTIISRKYPYEFRGKIETLVPPIPKDPPQKWKQDTIDHIKIPRTGESDLYMWIRSKWPTLDKWESQKFRELCDELLAWLPQTRSSVDDPVEAFEKRSGISWSNNHIITYTPIPLPDRKEPSVDNLMHMLRLFQGIIDQMGAREWEYWLVDRDVHVAYGDMAFIGDPPPVVPPDHELGNQTASLGIGNLSLSLDGGSTERGLDNT